MASRPKIAGQIWTASNKSKMAKQMAIIDRFLKEVPEVRGQYNPHYFLKTIRDSLEDGVAPSERQMEIVRKIFTENGMESEAHIFKNASLRSRIIRLAHANPEIRSHLLPILHTASDVLKIRLTPGQKGAPGHYSVELNGKTIGFILDGRDEGYHRLDRWRFSPLDHGKEAIFGATKAEIIEGLRATIDSYIRRAHANLELRTASVPAGWEEVKRGEYIDEIWPMYQATYRMIGMSKSSPSEMISDYDTWEIFKKTDHPIAFVVSKRTLLGIKLGLAGSDGSPEAKTALKTYLGKVFNASGRYGEVSHAVERIVMRSNPPVVCAVYADEVLKKNVVPSKDAIHYMRSLSGVGNVEKILVGKPKGVPTTDSNHPSCPVGDPSSFSLTAGSEIEDPCDTDGHLFCQIDL